MYKKSLKIYFLRDFLCPYTFALVFGLSALAFQRLAPNALRLKVYLKPKPNLQALKFDTKKPLRKVFLTVFFECFLMFRK